MSLRDQILLAYAACEQSRCTPRNEEMKTEVESEPAISHSALRERLEDGELPSHKSTKEKGVNILQTAVAYCHFASLLRILVAKGALLRRL